MAQMDRRIQCLIVRNFCSEAISDVLSWKSEHQHLKVVENSPPGLDRCQDGAFGFFPPPVSFILLPHTSAVAGFADTREAKALWWVG